MTTPDWLSKRGGDLRLGSDGQTWYVLFDQKPNYALRAVPAAGKFGCDIKQTINGQRVESQGVYPEPLQAIGAGLEDLAKSLGWR